MTDHQNVAQRIRFDAEDRLPPAYWDRLRKPISLSSNNEIQVPSKNTNIKIPNNDDWVNAPEFIPRHKQTLAYSFGFINPMSTSQYETGMYPDTSNYPYTNHHSALMETSYDKGVSYSLPPSTPVGNGPPITAVVLKKKRKRRPRQGKTAMEVMNTQSEETNESLRDLQSFQLTPTSDGKDPTMPILPKSRCTKLNGYIRSMTSEPDLTSFISMERSLPFQTECKKLADSCPNLSATQLELWDNILYKTMITDTTKQLKLRQKARKELFNPQINSSTVGAASDKLIKDCSKDHSDSSVMKTSIYELCPFSLYNEDGNNEPFNPSEKQEFIKRMTTSHNESNATVETAFGLDGNVLVNKPSKIASKSIEDSYQIIKKSAAELENLKTKPLDHDNQQLYPSRSLNFHQHVKYDSKTNKYHTVLYDDIYEFDPQVEEDYFEGMHIRVNAFEVNADLTLSESELPQPSRFQQMQWALQRQKEKYVSFKPPERVCCSLI